MWIQEIWQNSLDILHLVRIPNRNYLTFHQLWHSLRHRDKLISKAKNPEIRDTQHLCKFFMPTIHKFLWVLESYTGFILYNTLWTPLNWKSESQSCLWKRSQLLPTLHEFKYWEPALDVRSFYLMRLSLYIAFFRQILSSTTRIASQFQEILSTRWEWKVKVKWRKRSKR